MGFWYDRFISHYYACFFSFVLVFSGSYDLVKLPFKIYDYYSDIMGGYGFIKVLIIIILAMIINESSEPFVEENDSKEEKKKRRKE